MIDRRAFLAGAVALLAAPLAAEAQPAEKVWRIGLVSIGSDPARPVSWQPFVEAMRMDAQAFGVAVEGTCQVCRSEKGKKLDKERVAALAGSFFVLGTMFAL